MSSLILTAILIDDEEDCRIALRNFITKYCPGVTILAEADSVEKAVQHIAALKPMLIFLDINMPGADGFALFEQIPEPDFHTIFITAYDEYAIRAIRHHALDYILKPININDLVKAVERARALQGKNILQQQLHALLDSVQKIRPAGKVCLPLADGFVYIPINDIIRCEAEGNYTIFHFSNRPKLMVCRTLGSYETIFKDHAFARVHNRHLINLMHMEKYQRGRGGMIVMSDKTEVIVSQRRRDHFLSLINNHPDLEDDTISG